MTSITGPATDIRAPRSDAGFTILELVLVMVIICSVLGAAAPSLRGFFISRRTHDTASRILSLTRLARSQAVSEGRIYRLVLDSHQGHYQLLLHGQEGLQEVGSSLGREFGLPDGTRMEVDVAGAPGRDYLDFFPDGRSEPANIVLTDIKGGVVTIRCLAPAELFAITEDDEDS
jgi:prepilin-type N-terminal cleavage/methylation domain-containing protein